MHLNRPAYLHLLWFIIPLIFLYLHAKKRERRLSGIQNLQDGEKPLLAKNSSLLRGRRLLKQALFLLCLIFLILSLSGPRWGLMEKTVERKGIDIVVALDLSKSMLTEDISPNRLERAKLELASFIDSRRGDRVGIVAFAGSAFVACPLTMDYGAAKNFLKGLKAGTIPAPGTDLAGAMELSVDLLKGYAGREKVIVLLTDGEDTLGDPLKVAEYAATQGVSIYTLGFGTRTGGPIPIYDRRGKISGYKRDGKGEIVMSRLDGSLLGEMADKGSGAHFYGADAVTKLQEELDRKEKSLTTSRIFTNLEERFQYPLFLAFLFLSLEILISERRKGA